ncbi:MAG: thiamine pyrophosphate-dependent enzyme [Candidatus Berkelbacteria bacterium]|nr:thiamine pyrophosphate-dependent enzyme [Candidatus Berkelbacteria bacterium]
MENIAPISWKKSSKPHLFCPGCGHGIVLKQLGYAFDEMKIARDVTFGIDIGCSLLAWNFFDADTIQTHHGRTTSVMVGYKMAKPERIALAYMGDGGGYAIGLQALLHAAYRNNPVTVILVNNENYAMTGGQSSPTTPVGMVTSTSPNGKRAEFGKGLHGPELISEIAAPNAYIARVSISNPIQLKITLKKAIENQVKNKVFSFVEVLSICPTNWKTNAKESFEILREAEKLYPIKEFTKEKEVEK